MWSSYRRRFWIETALAATTAFLAVLTLISRELVVAALAACVLFSALARAEWRRANAPAQA
jgi:hypothetical protein